nr:MAG TPA: hypothetical protein [Bacteriophage sp.]
MPFCLLQYIQQIHQANHFVALCTIQLVSCCSPIYSRFTTYNILHTTYYI